MTDEMKAATKVLRHLLELIGDPELSSERRALMVAAAAVQSEITRLQKERKACTS